MDQRKLIYDNNRISINLMLSSKGYPQSYSGFLKAVDELGEDFLHAVYTDVSSRWSNADGKGWAKFKNIFSKTTDILGKVGQGANVANSFLNRPTDTNNNPQSDPAPEKKPWKPNIYLWGGVAAAIIVILLIIYFFKS